jgi:hypothetical protein
LVSEAREAVVGVHVGVEAGDQLDAQFTDQGQVAAVLLEHRIDQQALAAGGIGQQIGERAGLGVKQLAKQQRAAPGRCR